jgi:hypothetical protein
MSQARQLSQKTDALVGGLRLALLSDVPMEHVEAQLQRKRTPVHMVPKVC